jgi:hypothetical protein
LSLVDALSDVFDVLVQAVKVLLLAGVTDDRVEIVLTDGVVRVHIEKKETDLLDADRLVNGVDRVCGVCEEELINVL